MSLTTLCYCHDPLVFGHRCTDEPTGAMYSDPREIEDVLVEAFEAVRVMAEYLANARREK